MKYRLHYRGLPIRYIDLSIIINAKIEKSHNTYRYLPVLPDWVASPKQAGPWDAEILGRL